MTIREKKLIVETVVEQIDLGNQKEYNKPAALVEDNHSTSTS